MSEQPSGSTGSPTLTAEIERALRVSVKPEDWWDWKWQLRHAFSDPYEICEILGLERPSAGLSQVIDEFVVRVTPYYLNLLCNARRTQSQAQVQKLAKTFLPSSEEVLGSGISAVDGMGEEGTHPRRAISMLYPDRAVLFTTNVCPIYCRYCFRKRKVGRVGESGMSSAEIDDAVTAIDNQPSIRDVIISGGEPLMLNDDTLVHIVERVAAINHVDIIRIDTKFMAAFPLRFSSSSGGKVFHFTFHFVHPLEVSEDVKRVTWELASRGVLMNAYIPLLRGVNDDRAVLKDLFWQLALAKVRPYYLVQNVTHRWNHHFQVPVEKGRQLMDGLSGELSGIALPQYIAYLPNAGGKVALTSPALVNRTERGWVIKNHQGREFFYYDPVDDAR